MSAIFLPRSEPPAETGRPDEPWWTRKAIDYIEAWLQSAKERRELVDIVEYGSGASTPWLMARTLGHLTSVEHHPVWFSGVEDYMRDLNRDGRWQGILQPAELPGPRHAEGHAHDGVHNNYFRYVWAPSLRGSRLIIIDGRARAECLMRARDRITHAEAGDEILVMLDDAQRDRYQYAIDAMDEAELYRQDFHNKDRLTIVWSTAWPEP